jgi:hypothetical protein
MRRSNIEGNFSFYIGVAYDLEGLAAGAGQFENEKPDFILLEKSTIMA